MGGSRSSKSKTKTKTKTKAKAKRGVSSKKVVLFRGVGTKKIRNLSRTNKLKVKKIDYANRCKKIKSREFMRDVNSKNLSNRVTRKFKRGKLENKLFLNHGKGIADINNGKWTTEMRRLYKKLSGKYGMKPTELDEFKSDYKCEMFRTISKNHNQVIIGILSVPTTAGGSGGATSYIPQSYVKWIEMHGARVVPIMFDIPKQMINFLLNQIDGLLLIGGTIESAIIEKAHYRFLSTLRYIVQKITRFNLIGNHFPIFSICLGFQLLPIICCDERETISDVSDNFINNKGISFLRKYGADTIDLLPVKNRDMLVGESMQDHFSDTEKKKMSHEPCTAMFHNKSFIMGAKYMNKYNNFIDVTATSSVGGKSYVAAYQFKSLPYYGVQFHPEKVFYEHRQENIPRGDVAKMLSSKLCNMFIEGCSKNYNLHVFGTNNDANLFIENYDLLSRENAAKILFPGNDKMFNPTMIDSSYYFGRIDNIKSEILGIPDIATTRGSIKSDIHDDLRQKIVAANEKEDDFNYPI